MHWTTELLNKYKEALVAFDTDYVTGYHFLRENNLNRGICKAITGWTSTGTIRYVSDYTRRVTKGLYLADMPVVVNHYDRLKEAYKAEGKLGIAKYQRWVNAVVLISKRQEALEASTTEPAGSDVPADKTEETC